MATISDSIIEIVRRYIKELESNNIKISGAIIFGSHAKGTAKEESDIDVALVSDDFSGDRFEDWLKIIPFKRKIDSRIEPIPFRTEDFNNGGMLAEEIKKTGKAI